MNLGNLEGQTRGDYFLDSMKQHTAVPLQCTRLTNQPSTRVHMFCWWLCCELRTLPVSETIPRASRLGEEPSRLGEGLTEVERRLVSSFPRG